MFGNHVVLIILQQSDFEKHIPGQTVLVRQVPKEFFFAKQTEAAYACT